ncbi:hypothetical protein N7447_009523 [Penicillium robsamsonii]|uniref:uncharacterized protein n=1 Tax=Penicillium robsamsonii TaxID=1792511 RepID=UPI00254766C4|nr:uncharacterized protein N7447_009523 [Penicillium robsamsonii]KAJ5817290.1 hypothetical protein N7447_009523 [Penicillium robsamsonii]
MFFISEPRYYQALLAAAIVLLWGVMAWNGTIVALVTAAWTGVLDDGKALHTTYTGIFLLDFPISVLVAFFFAATDGSHPDYQLFVMDAYSILQPAFVWLYADQLRLSSQQISTNPIIWGLLWQAFGGAVAFPAYFLVRMKIRDHPYLPAGKSATASARAIPFSFFLGAVLPAVVGMMTRWYSRSDGTHQIVLALWSTDPVLVSLIQLLLVKAQSPWTSKAALEQTDTTSWWLRVAFALSAIVAGVTHVYALGSLVLSKGDMMAVARIYFPWPGQYSHDVVLPLTYGPWLFLKYDWILMSLASVGWAFFQLRKAQCSPKNGRYWAVVSTLLLAGCILLGAGSTVSVALFWKEGLLQKKRGAKNETRL